VQNSSYGAFIFATILVPLGLASNNIGLYGARAASDGSISDGNTLPIRGHVSPIAGKTQFVLLHPACLLKCSETLG